MEKKMIVFDMDGTLVHTRSAVFAALEKLSIPFHLEAFDKQDIARLRNVRSLYFLRELKIPLWKAPFILKKVQKLLGEEIAEKELVEGMPDVLRELKKRGYTLGVATSNSEKNTKLFFEKYHGTYFDFKRSDIFVFGKHRALKKIAKKRGVKLDNMYYVGDETRDILAARRAGIKVIAVTWGFNARKILESMYPARVIDSPSELLEYFKN